MKKITILFTALMITLMVKAQEQNEWGPWNTIDCFKGIEFRVKNTGYNEYAKKYNWAIEMKNNYDKKISFSFKLTTPQDGDKKTNARTTIKAGGVDKGYWSLLETTGNLVWVYIDRVCFHHPKGFDECTEYNIKGKASFAECDNGTPNYNLWDGKKGNKNDNNNEASEKSNSSNEDVELDFGDIEGSKDVTKTFSFVDPIKSFKILSGSPYLNITRSNNNTELVFNLKNVSTPKFKYDFKVYFQDGTEFLYHIVGTRGNPDNKNQNNSSDNSNNTTPSYIKDSYTPKEATNALLEITKAYRTSNNLDNAKAHIKQVFGKLGYFVTREAKPKEEDEDASDIILYGSDFKVSISRTDDKDNGLQSYFYVYFKSYKRLLDFSKKLIQSNTKSNGLVSESNLRDFGTDIDNQGGFTNSSFLIAIY